MAKKTLKILRYVGLLLILAVTCTLLLRMCAHSSMPEPMERLSWNAATRAAYEKEGADMRVLILNMPEKYRIAPDGKFSVHEVYYLPEAKQLQFTLRCNDSTLRTLAGETEVSFEELDERERPLFDVFVTDDREIRYTCEFFAHVERGRYNYERYVVDGIELDGIRELALEVMGLRDGGKTYEKEDKAYSAVALYNSDIPSTEKKLTKADLSGFEEIR